MPQYINKKNLKTDINSFKNIDEYLFYSGNIVKNTIPEKMHIKIQNTINNLFSNSKT